MKPADISFKVLQSAKKYLYYHLFLPFVFTALSEEFYTRNLKTSGGGEGGETTASLKQNGVLKIMSTKSLTQTFGVTSD